jgi:hypothetical protein
MNRRALFFAAALAVTLISPIASAQQETHHSRGIGLPYEGDRVSEATQREVNELMRSFPHDEHDDGGSRWSRFKDRVEHFKEGMRGLPRDTRRAMGRNGRVVGVGLGVGLAIMEATHLLEVPLAVATGGTSLAAAPYIEAGHWVVAGAMIAAGDHIQRRVTLASSNVTGRTRREKQRGARELRAAAKLAGQGDEWIVDADERVRAADVEERTELGLSKRVARFAAQPPSSRAFEPDALTPEELEGYVREALSPATPQRHRVDKVERLKGLFETRIRRAVKTVEEREGAKEGALSYWQSVRAQGPIGKVEHHVLAFDTVLREVARDPNVRTPGDLASATDNAVKLAHRLWFTDLANLPVVVANATTVKEMKRQVAPGVKDLRQLQKDFARPYKRTWQSPLVLRTPTRVVPRR